MNYEQRVREILFATHNCDHEDCATPMAERIQALQQLITEAKVELLERLEIRVMSLGFREAMDSLKAELKGEQHDRS